MAESEPDKFMQMMEMMKGRSDEERMASMEEKKPMCICPNCPVYNDCAKENNELLYCATGKSPACELDEAQPCICGSCPITPAMGLKKLYFCTKGSEAQQRGLM